MEILKTPNKKTSKDTSKYITVDNELVETSSKRQKTLSSLTPQTRNTNTATLDYGASCMYTIIANNLTTNLIEFGDPNWESNFKCTMMDQKILRIKKMQNVFKSIKHNLEVFLFFSLCIGFKMDVVF